MLAYCSSAASLISLQSFYNYARGHCEVAQASNCSGVCWEEGMGDGGVLVLQDVGTMKSLHWRYEMWFDDVKRKQVQSFLGLQLLLARSLPRRRSRHACVCFICKFCMCVCIYVYVCMCADMYICICMHVCMYLYIYAFIHMCMCMCMHICV